MIVQTPKSSAMTKWRANRLTQPIEDRSRFRPFITAWGGSDLQIAGSRIAMLGYDSSKAFGLTQSSGQPRSVAVCGQGKPTNGQSDRQQL